MTGQEAQAARRTRIGFTAVTALVIAAVIGAVLVVANRTTADRRVAVDASTGFVGALLPPGVPAPDFDLRDEAGKGVSLREYRGKTVLVTFVYSTCEESCGPQMQLIRGALDDLGRDIPVLAVSAAPREDTPARARRFLGEQRMLGRARFVLGTQAELGRVYRGFFVQPQTKEADHQTRLVLLDGRGAQRVGYFLENVTPEGIAADVRKLERSS